jgi:hypothetical protein
MLNGGLHRPSREPIHKELAFSMSFVKLFFFFSCTILISEAIIFYAVTDALDRKIVLP